MPLIVSTAEPFVVGSRRRSLVAGRVACQLLHPREQGHDWLGHRSITSMAVYTALALNRFKDV
jgi:hypothetical protein